MKLIKITLSGLRGRKKDTRLLWLVVTLAYLFITLSTTVAASMDSTKADRRSALYGQWQVMASGLSDDAMTELGGVVPHAELRVLGTSSVFGVVGTLNEDMARCAGFQLLEGRLPQKDNEIVLESKQLVASGTNAAVGDTVTVSVPVFLGITEEAAQQQKEEVQAYYAQLMERCEAQLEIYRETQLEEDAAAVLAIMDENNRPRGMTNYRGTPAWYGREVRTLFDIQRMQNKTPFDLGEAYDIPFEELTRDQLAAVIRQALVEIKRQELPETQGMTAVARKENHLLGHGDVILRTKASVFSGTDVHGYVEAYLQMDLVVSGIIETYSDRWDNGTTALPNTFITEERLALCDEALQSLRGAYPYLDIPAHSGRSVLFFRDADASPESVFSTLLPVYNRLLEESEPVYRVSDIITDRYGDAQAFFTAVDDVTGEKITFRAAQHGSVGETDFVFSHPEDPACAYTVPYDRFVAGTFSLEGMHPSGVELLTEAVLEENGSAPLRLNRYAYPLKDSSGFMLSIVVAVLFVATMCAVLQIFITQIRRRMQRIAMLKAIGTTDRQTAQMLFYEFLFFLCTTLPVGVGLGLLGGRGAVELLNTFRNASEQLVFSMDPRAVLVGIAAGTAALFFGMAVPGIMAVRLPLTGRMTVTKKVPARRRSHSMRHRQTFFSLVRRNMSANRGRTWGNALLSAFICTIAVLCTYIGYASFESYRTTVQWEDRPDYTLVAGASLSGRGVRQLVEALQGVGEIRRIEAVNAGENIFVTFDGIEDSPLVQELTLAAPKNSGDGLQTREILSESKTGITADLYAMESDHPLFARLLEAAQGTVDTAAYDEGRQVLVFVPMYHTENGKTPKEADLEGVAPQDAMKEIFLRGGRTQISARSWAPYAFEEDTALQPGDTLTMSGRSVTVTETSKSVQETAVQAEVAAVIHCFPEEGVWPVSNHLRGYTVIGSNRALQAVYPRAIRSYVREELTGLRIMNDLFYGDTYGRTYIDLYAEDTATRENTDFYLEKYADAYGLDLQIHRESIQKRFSEAQMAMILAAFLGFAAVMLSVLILNNAVASSLEQERSRMGILQSMGITGGQFLRQQLYAGILYAVFGLAAAHAVWLLAATVFSVSAGGAACGSFAGFFAYMTGQSLWQYPWALHGSICAACAVLCVLLQVLPMFPLIRCKPIDNIKFRK